MTRSSRKKRPTKKAPSTSQANGFLRGKDKLAMQTEQVQQTQQQRRQEGGTDALAMVNPVESDSRFSNEISLMAPVSRCQSNE